MRYFILLAIISLFFSAPNVHAEDHTINIAGLTYSPAVLNVNVGDQITIKATSTHPTIEVSESTWNASGTTPLPGGWGTETSEFTFTVNEAGTHWYVCGNHVNDGMKGVINVSAPSGTNQAYNRIGFRVNAQNSSNIYYNISSPKFSSGKLELYHISGQLAFTFAVYQGDGTLRASLAPGIYFYAISNEEEGMLSSGKLVISR